MNKPLLIPLLLILVSCTPVLDRGVWEDKPYKALVNLLKDKSLKGSYVVFDCDNTTIVNDVSHTLMVYQIENLEFADAVEESFVHGLPRVDFIMESVGMTAKEMGDSLVFRYKPLKERLLGGTPLEELKKEQAYLDYRAEFLAFYEAICENYGYGEICLWEPMLSSGLPIEVVQENFRYWLSQGRVWEEEWVSADGRFRATAEKGLVISPEMKNLYAALRRRGITPYICSASAEWLVEALVCNPENGLGMAPEEVFGLRFKDGEYDPEYHQSYKQGKVDCIDSYIAPLYGGKQPVLVAGDSSGDIPMLTAYPDMRVGLIINRHRGGEIEGLLDIGDGRYVSQTVFNRCAALSE